MPIASKKEIEVFLSEVDEIIDISFELVWGREKNSQGIIDLGLTKSDVKNIIRNLELIDYVTGPIKEKKPRKGYLWVFGIQNDITEVYIKLKVSNYNDPGDLQKTVICLSFFHPSDRPLAYPYK